jgi:hypothetical protein
MTSNALKKFLTADQIESAIRDVSALASEQGVRVALAGGVAMQFYGSDRLTKDIDFIGSDVLEGLSESKPLGLGGVQGKSPSRGIQVDIIARAHEVRELYEEALELAPHVPELNVAIVLPEHLAAMKLYADRTKDQGDLLTLIWNGLDLEAARRIIKKHLGQYAFKDFNARVQEAEWLAERDRSLDKK